MANTTKETNTGRMVFSSYFILSIISSAYAYQSEGFLLDLEARQTSVSTVNCSLTCTGDQICLCSNGGNCRCQTVCDSAENKEVYQDQNGNIIGVCPVNQDQCLGCCPNWWSEGCEPCCSDRSEGKMRSEMSGIWFGISMGIILVIVVAIIYCVCFCSICSAILKGCSSPGGRGRGRGQRAREIPTYEPNTDHIVDHPVVVPAQAMYTSPPSSDQRNPSPAGPPPSNPPPSNPSPAGPPVPGPLATGPPAAGPPFGPYIQTGIPSGPPAARSPAARSPAASPFGEPNPTYPTYPPYTPGPHSTS